MKFCISWLEEKSTVVEVENLEAAQLYTANLMMRLGGFPKARTLSIQPLADAPPGGKPPTPFGAPPGGTLGGGHVYHPEPLPDVRAA